MFITLCLNHDSISVIKIIRLMLKSQIIPSIQIPSGIFRRITAIKQPFQAKHSLYNVVNPSIFSKLFLLISNLSRAIMNRISLLIIRLNGTNIFRLFFNYFLLLLLTQNFPYYN